MGIAEAARRRFRPTLVIRGRDDRIVCPNEIEELVRGLPNYSYEKLARCGHAPQIECADLVNPMVARFLSAGRHP